MKAEKIYIGMKVKFPAVVIGVYYRRNPKTNELVEVCEVADKTREIGSRGTRCYLAKELEPADEEGEQA